MPEEYGGWPESEWTAASIEWRKSKNITAGVDIGTTGAQAVIFCDGQLFSYANIRTSVSFSKTADAVIRRAMTPSGMTLEDIGCVVGTGWGGQHVKYAAKTMDEIHCHAKGARFLFGPEVKTVVDMGGQTCKAIRLHSWDRIRDFMINDKCATGFGRHIETVCDLLNIPLEEIGKLSLEVKEDPEPVSTTCYTFAATETLGLFRPDFRAEPLTDNEICASYLFAVAWRILGLIGRLQPLDTGDVGVYPELGFTGGLAKNPGITKRLERELNIKALESRYDPQLAGAIGAALLA